MVKFYLYRLLKYICILLLILKIHHLQELVQHFPLLNSSVLEEVQILHLLPLQSLELRVNRYSVLDGEYLAKRRLLLLIYFDAFDLLPMHEEGFVELRELPGLIGGSDGIVTLETIHINAVFEGIGCVYGGAFIA